jgi:hypothetical protein
MRRRNRLAAGTPDSAIERHRPIQNDYLHSDEGLAHTLRKLPETMIDTDRPHVLLAGSACIHLIDNLGNSPPVSGSQDNTVAEHVAAVGKTSARQAYHSSLGCMPGR